MKQVADSHDLASRAIDAMRLMAAEFASELTKLLAEHQQ